MLRAQVLARARPCSELSALLLAKRARAVPALCQRGGGRMVALQLSPCRGGAPAALTAALLWEQRPSFARWLI